MVLHFQAGGEGARFDLLSCLFPHLGTVQIETVTEGRRGLLISARVKNTEAACAGCGTLSPRVHSRYRRRLQDVTCGEVPVTIELQVRRWFCVNPGCRIRTFAEQVPELAQPYARRTSTLRRLLEHIALALAGRAGARLADRLGITVSRSLLIRLIRALPDPEIGPVSVLGVDEFAKRRGQSYATILIDMTTHRPIDVLDDRTAEAFAAWLREHPGIQVICRDRAGGFAEGAREGAPDATQVADRWHLWHNLCTAVESTVRAHRADLAEPMPETQPREEEPEVNAAPDAPESRTAIRTRERHATIHALLAEGKTHTDICKILDLADKTVRKFRLATTADELINGPRKSMRPIDRYGSYLHRRWNEGVYDAAQLHSEISAQGYNGSKRSVRRFVEPLRPYQHVADLPAPPPKVREATRWLTSHPDHLTEDEVAKLSQLKNRSATLARLAEHVTTFAQMMTGLTGAKHLEGWLTGIETDDLPHLHTFARGVRRDQDAVTNGLTLSHSSGAVEGNVCRIKALKRQMFGRANLDLLRKRVLLA
ncbi:ISL3 family transposase [Nonomuraea sp. NPDC002799]